MSLAPSLITVVITLIPEALPNLSYASSGVCWH
jgi:hypothetical protein